MLNNKILKQALRREVSSQIYSRGLEYYNRGRVKKWGAEEYENGMVAVTGKVEGTELYETTLEFNSQKGKLISLECDCPYEYNCKHAVALALAFANSLNKPDYVANASAIEIKPNSAEQNDTETRLRATLRELGLSDRNMPQSLITQLLNYQQNNKNVYPKPTAGQTEIFTKAKPFNPCDYYIALSSYNGYIPTFYEKAWPGQQAGINKILEQKDLASAQRELLVYIKTGKFKDYKSPPPDLGRLFPLLVESGFPIYENIYSYNDRQIKVNLAPEPLRAEIIYEPREHYADQTKIRHDFFFRMPEEYWKGKDHWYDKAFVFSGSSLIFNRDNTLELHRLTELLIPIIARLEAVFDYESNARKAKYHQTKLTGQEMSEFEKLADEASRLLTLSFPPPSFKTYAVPKSPRPALAVDFDNTSQTIRVAPVIDYGIYQQDISESVYLSRKDSGNIFSHRESFDQPGSHIVTVANNIIHHAKIDEKQEIGFYRKLAEQPENLGFTKTLKYQRKGRGPVEEFLRDSWPKLLAHAEEQNYAIIFTKDEIAKEQTTFRADFETDMEAPNDWLYFDVACYCGDEKVTLEKLLEFLESGRAFWRQADGSLAEISNRPELERLARLLKSFHARENGGFEGKLYHVPELEYVMTSSPHYNAERTKSFQKFTKEIQNGKPLKKVSLPSELKKVLRPYQKEGVDWLYFLRSYRFAGILADDMGLGKTAQALAVLAKERVPGKPSLVVCPKTLLYNWKLEAEKFAPELKLQILEGTVTERAIMAKQLKKYDLVVVSYSTLKQEEENFTKSGIQFNYAVLDEAQFIKNHSTKNARAVKKIPADYRMALTGTPLENSVSEIWSIFDFLMPGFLGNYEQFAKNFHKPIMDKGDRQVLEHLRRKIEPFMLRRTKAEVLKDLPPKIEVASQCHLTPAQNILYQQILAQVRGQVFKAVEEKGFKSAQIHILAGLTKLRQACNHPALLIKDEDFRQYESAKLDMCIELVEEVLEGRRKVLIFSQFTSMLDIVSAALKDKSIKYLYLSGKTKNRQDMVNAFNTDPKIPVFLISLKAGGTGLNLTAADTVIIFDPWWNPSVENQAIDRAHRIGQKKTVNVYRLLTTGTIEEKIQNLKAKKQRLFDALVSESGDLFKKLTWDDVRELFKD